MRNILSHGPAVDRLLNHVLDHPGHITNVKYDSYKGRRSVWLDATLNTGTDVRVHGGTLNDACQALLDTHTSETKRRKTNIR